MLFRDSLDPKSQVGPGHHLAAPEFGFFGDLPGLDFLCRNWVMSSHSTSQYRKHRFPSEIIVHAV